MRTLNVKLLLALFICFSPICIAQETMNCDELRGKISVLKGVAAKIKSPSVRRVNDEALLTVYTQLSQCVEQDIASTAEIEAAVENTNAAPAVKEKLQGFREEKGKIEDEIAKLKAKLNPNLAEERGRRGVGASSESNSSGRSEPPSAESSSPRAVSSAPTGSPSAPIEPSRALGVEVADAAPKPQATPACLPGSDYSDAPLALSDIANKVAADVVRRNDANRSIFLLSEMILYTFFDAASPKSSKMVRDLGAYEYLSETARTDKQLGGAANSNGAVGAIEKPGFATLLGFAVEHGAINKQNDGTNLTLSTSLYSLYAFNKPKTAESYASAMSPTQGEGDTHGN